MREVRIGLLVRLLDLGSSCSFTVTEFVQWNWWKTAQDDTSVRIRVLLGIGYLGKPARSTMLPRSRSISAKRTSGCR